MSVHQPVLYFPSATIKHGDVKGNGRDCLQWNLQSQSYEAHKCDSKVQHIVCQGNADVSFLFFLTMMVKLIKTALKTH